MINYIKFRQGITADEMRKVSLQDGAPMSPLSRAIHDEIPVAELRYVPEFPSLPEGTAMDAHCKAGEHPPEGYVASFSEVPTTAMGWSGKVFPWTMGKIVNRSAAVEPLLKEICDE